MVHLGSGLVYHVTDIYFGICEENCSQGAALEDLKMFEQLMGSHPNENIRLYIGEKIFEKYKERLAKKY